MFHTHVDVHVDNRLYVHLWNNALRTEHAYIINTRLYGYALLLLFCYTT